MTTVKMLTNNQQVMELAQKQGWDCRFLRGRPPAVLQEAQNWATQGWRLAADPLAGYFSRHNPYHTVFMQSGQASRQDWLQLERAIIRWQGYQTPPAEKQPAVRSAYRELDYALAAATMEQLEKFVY